MSAERTATTNFLLRWLERGLLLVAILAAPHVWTALHFIQHYNAFQALKGKHRVGQPRDISRILQIKSRVVIAEGRRNQACKGSFSNLTRTEQCDYGESFQKASNPLHMQIAIYHSRMLP